MSRVKVWAEAQEEYLIKQNIEKKEIIVQMSDDELNDFYCRIIKEKGLEKDAKEFTRSYCMQFK